MKNFIASSSFQCTNSFENFFTILLRSLLFTVRFSSSAVKTENAPNFVLYQALGQLPTDNCQRTTANEVTNFTSGQLPTDNCQRTIANAFFSHSHIEKLLRVIRNYYWALGQFLRGHFSWTILIGTIFTGQFSKKLFPWKFSQNFELKFKKPLKMVIVQQLH